MLSRPAHAGERLVASSSSNPPRSKVKGSRMQVGGDRAVEARASRAAPWEHMRAKRAEVVGAGTVGSVRVVAYPAPYALYLVERR